MDLSAALRLSLNPAQPHVVAFVGGGGKSSAIFRLARELAGQGRRVVVTTTTHFGAPQVAGFPGLIEVTGESLPLARIGELLDRHSICVVVGPQDQARRAGILPERVDELADSLRIAAILVEADGSRRRPVKAPAAHEPVLPSSTNVLVPVLGVDGVGAEIGEATMHRPDAIRRVLGLPVAEPSVRLSPKMAARLLADRNGGAKRCPPGARLMPLINKADNPRSRAVARTVARALANDRQSALIGAVGVCDSPISERWAPLAAVVLAAGEGRRMGRAKPLVEIDGEPMVVRAARVALQSGVDDVLVITGAHAEPVERALLDGALAGHGRLRLVRNPDWASGQASSVRAAIDALASDVAGALFLPVDQPDLDVALLRRLVQGWRRGARIGAPSVAGDVRGAPALFDRSLWAELSALQGDVGGKPILRKYRDEVVAVEAPDFWLRDVDTPEDLRRLALATRPPDHKE